MIKKLALALLICSLPSWLHAAKEENQRSSALVVRNPIHEIKKPKDDKIKSDEFSSELKTGVLESFIQIFMGTILTLGTASLKAADLASDSYKQANELAKKLSPEGKAGYLLGKIAATALFTMSSYIALREVLEQSPLSTGVGVSLPAIHGGAGIAGALSALFSAEKTQNELPTKENE